MLVQADDAAGGLPALALLEPRDHALEAGQAAVDAAPARRDQLGEEGDVLDALAALAVHVHADALEPAEHVLEERSHLGDVLRDRAHLDAERLVDDRADALRERRLELGCGRGEAFEELVVPLVDGRRLRGRQNLDGRARIRGRAERVDRLLDTPGDVLAHRLAVNDAKDVLRRDIRKFGELEDRRHWAQA
jgi:hypothetical protein